MTLRHFAIPVVLLFAAGALPAALLFAPAKAAQGRTIPVYEVKVVAKYPHDRKAFTQGLVVDGNILIEGTGQLGESTLREVKLQTGAVLKQVRLANEVFGEGVTVMNGKIYQLTWKHHIAYVYDRATLKYEKMHRYEGEGWGLTNDGKHLILSDGTDTLRFIDPKTFNVHRRLRVRGENNAPLTDINELEYVNGEIFANVWYQDYIARIDPKSGRVKSWLNLKPLRPQAVRFDREAALNGIAWDAKAKKLYVTGKDWPELFEIKIGARSR
jgi:glutamine cyclotransferase